MVSNRDQNDFNSNGTGDVCGDADNDEILDAADNCPTTSNLDQRDSNRNGIGDSCDNENCPEPEFSINFETQRCTIFRADSCGDYNEGRCVPDASDTTPVTSIYARHLPLNDGYNINWTSRNAAQLQDYCGNLLGDNREVENYPDRYGLYFSNSQRSSSEGPYSAIPVNPNGDTRRVATFHWGSNFMIPYFGNTVSATIIERAHPEWGIDEGRGYSDSLVSFTENRTRLVNSSAQEGPDDSYNMKTGTLNCTVRATNTCGRSKNFHYSYSCIP